MRRYTQIIKPNMSRHEGTKFEFNASGVRLLPNSGYTLHDEQGKTCVDDVYNKCKRALEHFATKLPKGYSIRGLRLGPVGFVIVSNHSGQPCLMTREQYEGASEYGHHKKDLMNTDYLDQLVEECRAQKIKDGDVTIYRLLTTEERVEVISLHPSHLEGILHHVDPGLMEAQEDSNYDPKTEISKSSLPHEIGKKLDIR